MPLERNIFSLADLQNTLGCFQEEIFFELDRSNCTSLKDTYGREIISGLTRNGLCDSEANRQKTWKIILGSIDYMPTVFG